MGLFSKKEKKRCPICGNEMGFFGTKEVRDGEICENCEKMIRGQFDIEEFYVRRWGTSGYHRDDYKLSTADPLSELTVFEIQELIAEKKEQSKEAVQEFGSEYANLARVEDVMTIAPKAMDVGLKRAKALKDRVVATSLIVSGEIKKGDSVLLKNGSNEIETTVLDVIICSNTTTFITELAANMGKHKAAAGVNAWILLDVTEGVEEGTMICC